MKRIFFSFSLLVIGFCQAVFGQTTVDCSPTSGDGNVDGHPESSTYLSVRNSTQGVPNYAGQGISIGQNFTGNYSVYRGFFPFDTRSIPADAQITRAVLKVWGFLNNSTTDFDLCVVQSTQASLDLLDGADYTRASSTIGGYLNTSSLSTSGYNEIFLDTAGKSWINKGGYTKLAIRSREDINSSAPTNAEWVAVFSKESTHPPVLSITYEINSTPPPAPALSYPPNASIHTATPTLTWNFSGNVNYFHIQVDNNSDFSSPERENAYCLDGFWAVPELSTGTYYWRVRSHGLNELWSAWSSPIWSFTIQSSAPPAPTLAYPPDGHTTDDVTPDFSWNFSGNVNYFHIQIDNNSNFASPEREDSQVFTANWTPAAMSPGTYYWRVRSHGTNGEWGVWSSPIRILTIQSSAVLSLLRPGSGELITTNEIAFEWSNIGATRYELYVDNNSNLGSPEISKQHNPALSNYTQTSYTASRNSLQQNLCYWKVIAFMPGGGTVESATGQFTYQPPTEPVPNWVPLYRLYKGGIDHDHFYATSDNHRQTAIISGYVDERVEGFISLYRFNHPDMVEVFRFYDGAKRYHYYTTDPGDRDAQIIAGLAYEGITGYAYRNQQQNTLPLYHLKKVHSSTDHDHLYTISEFEKNNAVSAYGFTYEGIIGYVSPNGAKVEVPNYEAQPLIGGGINTSNGNFSFPFKTSFDIPSFGLSLTFAHFYNSLGIIVKSTVLPLGPGWSHSYNGYIDPAYLDNKTAVVWPDGAVHVYAKSGATFTAQTPGVYDELTESGGVYEVKRKDQIIYVFEKLPGALNEDPALLKKIRDRNGNEIVCTYQNGRLYRVTDPVNRYLEFTYYSDTGKSGLLMQVYDSSIGRTVRFDHDANGNLFKYVDARNNQTLYFYKNSETESHLLERIQLPKGNIIDNSYLGRKIRSQAWQGNTFTLDYSVGDVTRVTDGQGRISDFYQNPSKMIKKVQDVSGNTGFAEFFYDDPRHPTKPTKAIDRNGNITEYVYDAKGNVLELRQPLQVTHKYQYNSRNDVTLYTDPSNRNTQYNYDGNGNLSSVVDPTGRTININYGNRGLVSSISDPLHYYSYHYDEYGYLSTMQDPLFATNFNYDTAGRLTRVTNPKGQITRYSYSANDQLEDITRPDNLVMRQSYDPNDNLQSIADPRSQATIWGYDSQDLLTSITNPAGQATRYNYYGDGSLQSRSYANGQIANYNYDNSGRLQTISYSSHSVTLGHDDNGNIISVSDRIGTMSFDYDGLNRMWRHTDHRSKAVSYTYDKSGTIRTINYPGGKTVTYTYYADDRLHTVTDWDGRQTTYTYRADGSLQEVTLPNQTKCTYSYDAAGRLRGISNTKSGGSVIASYSFTLDAAGNIESEESNIPLNIPNLTSQNVGYNYDISTNRIQSAGSMTFAFDGKGNTTAKNSSNAFAFGYDEENRLTEIRINNVVTATYAYDGMGNLREATRNGVTTRYVVDVNAPMNQILMETDASGNPLNYYVYGLGLLYRVKANGAVHYYHYDNRGNTIAMTDQSQNITHKYVYEPFGKVFDKVEADANPFKFVGQYGVMDESNDFYFMRARFYDAAIGRFVSEDPVWDANLYSYVNSNPLINIDAAGLSWLKAAEAGHQIVRTLRSGGTITNVITKSTSIVRGNTGGSFTIKNVTRINSKIHTITPGKTGGSFDIRTINLKNIGQGIGRRFLAGLVTDYLLDVYAEQMEGGVGADAPGFWNFIPGLGNVKSAGEAIDEQGNVFVNGEFLGNVNQLYKR